MKGEFDSKFIVFLIGNELYASPLLSIREVLEYQTPKIMPNMVQSFGGVINVRGAIVGVLDLRIKFGYKAENGPRTPLLLCDTSRGAIAAVVDAVECVKEIPEDQIETNPPISSKIEIDYLIGVARSENRLISIIDIDKMLNEQEYKKASGV